MPLGMSVTVNGERIMVLVRLKIMDERLNECTTAQVHPQRQFVPQNARTDLLFNLLR